MFKKIFIALIIMATLFDIFYFGKIWINEPKTKEILERVENKVVGEVKKIKNRAYIVRLKIERMIKYNRMSVPTKITNDVVLVDSSSGVVVYSDCDRSLVLTAYHVIDGEISLDYPGSGFENNLKIRYLYPRIVKLKDGEDVSISIAEAYDIVAVDFDKKHDLALLEIKSDRCLFYSRLSKSNPKLGEDIWTVSNPNGTYRSLKKGIVGSEERFYGFIDPYVRFEISGGVAPGSSGGGVFNMAGELIGVIHAVNLLETDYCMGDNCINIPLTFIGLAIPSYYIRDFILSGPYSDYFNYLK